MFESLCKRNKDYVTLTPRWCERKDILKGWIVLHKSITGPRYLTHLNYIKIHCFDTKKKIYCRLFGPGTQPYKEHDQEKIKGSIYLDAHYQQLLGIDSYCVENKKYRFDIKKAKWWLYFFYACKYHPDDSIRIGSFLGIISLVLGLLSLIIAIIT